MTYPHGGARDIWRDGPNRPVEKHEVRDYLRFIEVGPIGPDGVRNLSVAALASLSVLTPEDMAVGDHVEVRDIGANFVRVADGEAVHVIDHTGAGGVRLDLVDKGNFADARIFGVVGDGVADDRAALLLADAAPYKIDLVGVTPRVASNVTLVSEVRLRDRAQFKEDAGVVVTLNGLIHADGSSALGCGPGTIVAKRIDYDIGEGGDFPTVQACVDYLPRGLWNVVHVRPFNDYVSDEHIRLSGFRSMDVQDPGSDANEDARLVIRALDLEGATLPAIGSIRANGCSAIQVNTIRPTRVSTFDNEDAAISVYDGSMVVTNCDLSGVINPAPGGKVQKGLLSYNGRLRCSRCVFGDGVFEYLMETKSMGWLIYDGGSSGHATESAFQTQSGRIIAQDVDNLTSEKQLIDTCNGTQRGDFLEVSTRQFHGVGGFAKVHGMPFVTMFPNTDILSGLVETNATVVAGGETGLLLSTLGGGAGEASASIRRPRLAGHQNWASGNKSMTVMIDVETPSATAEFYVVLGDLAGEYVGFKTVDRVTYGVYSDGVVETVAHEYPGTTGIAEFGFELIGRQVQFNERNQLLAEAVSRVDLPSGNLSTTRWMARLTDTAGVAVYGVPQMSFDISHSGK